MYIDVINFVASLQKIAYLSGEEVCLQYNSHNNTFILACVFVFNFSYTLTYKFAIKTMKKLLPAVEKVSEL